MIVQFFLSYQCGQLLPDRALPRVFHDMNWKKKKLSVLEHLIELRGDLIISNLDLEMYYISFLLTAGSSCRVKSPRGGIFKVLRHQILY